MTIKTTDAEGRPHEYHSLEEVPPEMRAEIEKLQSVPWKMLSRSSSSDGNMTQMTSTASKTLSTYKFTDASGTEQVYHSLEEMPPEIRTAFEQAQEQFRKAPDQGTGPASQ